MLLKNKSGLRPLLFLVVVLMCLMGSWNSAQGQYQIDLQFRGVRDTALIFGFYREEGRYIQDTAKFDASGHARLKRDSALAPGLYLFVLPNGHFVDLLIGSQQKFTFSLDLNDIQHSQKVEGAPLSQAFLDFQQFMWSKQEEARLMRKDDSIVRAMPDSPEKLQKQEALTQKSKDLDEQVRDYHSQLLEKHKDDLLGEFVKATIPITVPNLEIEPGVKNVDSVRMMRNYYYHREHYLDNINLASAGLLRTPLVVSKVNYFLDKVLLQIPDTLNVYCDKIIEKAYLNPETFSYWSSYLLNKYLTSEIIGMDAVFVHIAEKYFLSGVVTWATEEYLEKIRERVEHIKPNMLGVLAPNFKVSTLYAKPFELHKDKAEVTVLVFWEPSCSHCRTTIPKLDSIARTYDTKRLHMIGFMTTGDGIEWQKYVQEHKMDWWINVWDPERKSNFPVTYDIYSTPVVYVLDRDHKIMIKRIGWETLPQVLDELLKKK